MEHRSNSLADNSLESWARRQEDEKRQSQRPPQQQLPEKEVGPATKLSRWGTSFFDTDGTLVLPRKVVDKLRHHTKTNAREVQFLIDRDTGSVVDFQLGKQTSVKWDEQVYERHPNLLIIHPHSELTGPSGRDWFQALDKKHFREFIVVGSQHVWEFKVPGHYIPPSSASDDPEARFNELAKAVFNNLWARFDPDFKACVAQTSEIVNRLMASEYDVELYKSKTTDWALDLYARRSRRKP